MASPVIRRPHSALVLVSPQEDWRALLLLPTTMT